MPGDRSPPAATRIDLHAASRVLEITFDDGRTFHLPCEYLRVFSPSAEVGVADGRGEVVRGKENVNVTGIEPVGNYAVRLAFDDGHDTGVFSWKTLYELGSDYERNWYAYLAQRAIAAQGREANGAAVKVVVLYFAQLAERLARERHELDVAGAEADVQALLSALRSRGGEWESNLADDAIKVTVNKQFADRHTPLQNGDEVAIVPLRPAWHTRPRPDNRDATQDTEESV